MLALPQLDHHGRERGGHRRRERRHVGHELDARGRAFEEQRRGFTLAPRGVVRVRAADGAAERHREAADVLLCLGALAAALPGAHRHA